MIWCTEQRAMKTVGGGGGRLELIVVKQPRPSVPPPSTTNATFVARRTPKRRIAPHSTPHHSLGVGGHGVRAGGTQTRIRTKKNGRRDPPPPLPMQMEA